MEPQSVAQSRWYEEYSNSGIPSSFRIEPSGSVVEFMEYLKALPEVGRLALDLGCGRGRNSIFLAQHGFEVSSVDFVPEIIEGLRRQVKEFGLADIVHPYCADLTRPWPFPNDNFDIAIDTFCYKHQIRPEEKELYRRELKRVLKPGAFFLLTLAGTDDGYYGPFLEESPEPDRNVILDSANNILSILYTKEDVLGEFGGFMDLVHYEHKLKDGRMHNQVYTRSTHLFIFEVRDSGSP